MKKSRISGVNCVGTTFIELAGSLLPLLTMFYVVYVSKSKQYKTQELIPEREWKQQVKNC